MKYDDFIVGETFKTKSLHITEEEIIQFATTFDPQYMHIDKEKAEQSRFKGIIAEITNKKSIKKENGLVTVSLSTYNENEEIVFKGEVTALINNS